MKPQLKFALFAVLVSALYILCNVCPDRLISVSILSQRFLHMEVHTDCDKSANHENKRHCEGLAFEHVPSGNAKIPDATRLAAIPLAPQIQMLEAAGIFHVQSLYPPGCAPPFDLQFIKLRI